MGVRLKKYQCNDMLVMLCVMLMVSNNLLLPVISTATTLTGVHSNPSHHGSSGTRQSNCVPPTPSGGSGHYYPSPKPPSHGSGGSGGSGGCHCPSPPHHGGGGSSGGSGGGYYGPPTPTPTPTTPIVSSPPLVPSPPISGGGSGGSGGGYYGPPTPTPTTPIVSSPPLVPSPPIIGGGSGGGYYGPPTPTTPTTPIVSSPPPIVSSPPYEPSPLVPSPPIYPITPTPTTPTPYDPLHPPFPCTYWGTHPNLIFGVLGWWATVGGLFGVAALPGPNIANYNLQQILTTTRKDPYSSLYKEATASLLNSMATKHFPYSTNQVKSSFISALSTAKAAATQARLFRLANEGKLKDVFSVGNNMP